MFVAVKGDILVMVKAAQVKWLNLVGCCGVVVVRALASHYCGAGRFSDPVSHVG